jgi:small ubiquitin-related modifier
LNIRVRDQTGEETSFRVAKTTQLDKVFNAYAQRKGMNAIDLRFLFYGQRILSDQTPQDIGMEDGDQIDCMLGMRGSIGIFGDHAGSPGLAFLQPGAKLDDAPAAVVREIAARCRLGGSEGDAPYFASFQAAGLLSAAQRAALRSELDLGARGALDFKKPLTRREASSRLGAKVYGSLEALFSSHGGRVDEIVLRRSAVVGQCINFHTDVNHKTLQLCLNDDFDGGDLVFAADDKLVKPRRPAGSYTVHNDRIAHGVSTLERGARYALFFLMRAP